MNQQELDIRLREHRLWCESDGKKGQTLSLLGKDLSKLSFYKSQLRGANLSQCNLSYCNFRDSNLNSINVSESCFIGADLTYANISGADFKYIDLDENTNFDESTYEDLIIDFPTAERLPEYMDKNVMQIIEEYRITTRFLLKREYAHIGRSIIEDFSDLIQTKFKDINIMTEKHNINELILRINALKQEDREAIEKELFKFQRALRGEIDLEKLIEDPVLLDRVTLNNKFREFQLQIQQKQLESNNDLKQKVTTMADIVNELANQFKNNVLPTGPHTKERADFIVTLANGNRKTIETEDIVFIRSNEGHFPIIYMINGKQIQVNELISSLAAKLLRVNPIIITTHRSHIVNLKYVNRKENDKNIYKIYTIQYPEVALLVGQNHKKFFNDALLEFSIVLESNSIIELPPQE